MNKWFWKPQHWSIASIFDLWIRLLILARILAKITAQRRKILCDISLTRISYNNVLKKICVRHFNDWISSLLSLLFTVYDVIRSDLFIRKDQCPCVWRHLAWPRSIRWSSPYPPHTARLEVLQTHNTNLFPQSHAAWTMIDILWKNCLNNPVTGIINPQSSSRLLAIDH